MDCFEETDMLHLAVLKDKQAKQRSRSDLVSHHLSMVQQQQQSQTMMRSGFVGMPPLP